MARNPDQHDLFYQPAYPSRTQSTEIDVSDFRSRLKRAMSRALKECPYDRHEVAMRMARALGQDGFSKATLDAYTAESKETHDISLYRFKAFVRATGQVWLWDFIVADDGLTMLIGDEARLAERALLDQQIEELKARRKTLSLPVQVARRPR